MHISLLYSIDFTLYNGYERPQGRVSRHHGGNDIQSMQPRFDFQAAADDILNSGDVLVTDSEALVQIDPAPERDILIDGDLQQGTAFQCRQSLLVNGSICGLENNECRIEARRNLLIAGDACHARLEGQNIHIGGGSRQSELRADEQISLGKDMVATKLKVGKGGSLQRHCEDLRRRLISHESSKLQCDRQRKQDEKILDRTCQLTSLPLDLNLGNLIRHGDGRVQIDLEPVYQSLDDASEKHLHAALNEFFAKGIMGALARTNRKYIVNNPTRAKVFTQFLSKLRDLYNLVAKCDQLGRSLERDRSELASLIANLPEELGSVQVGGSIVAPATIDFELADVRSRDSKIEARTARLQIEALDKEDDILVDISDISGQHFREISTADDLTAVAIRSAGGRPTLFSPAAELAS